MTEVCDVKRQVKWYFADRYFADPQEAGGLSIWFQYHEPTDLSDKVDVLLDVLRAAIGSKPFVVCDDADAQSGIWLLAYAKEHALPHTVLRKPLSLVLVGSESVELLLHHWEHDEFGLAWIAGLTVFVFRDMSSLREQVHRWSQFNGSWYSIQSDLPEFSLETQGDAEGLLVRPGLVNSEELLALMERTVTSLGMSWEKF